MQVPVIGLSFSSEGFLKKLTELINKNFDNLRFYRKGNREIPEKAFNKFREQYLAERVLDFLRDEGINLWITKEPIYSKGTNYVFGEGEYRGPVLVSIKRLRPEFYDEEADSDLLLSRLRKESIHEMGHCFGLDHCENPNCVMRYSNSIKAVDDKTNQFCDECQVKISANGLPLQ